MAAAASSSSSSSSSSGSSGGAQAEADQDNHNVLADNHDSSIRFPPYSVGFWQFVTSGSGSAFASFVLNSFDVVKVRLQYSQESLMPWTMARRIWGEGGARALMLRGATASMLREMTSSASRIVLYEHIRKLFIQRDTDAAIGLPLRVLAGLISGSMGAFVASPLDLVKVRFQVLPVNGPQAHRNSFEALYSIASKHGIAGLYRGVAPNVIRSALLTAGQLVTYDYAKFALRRWRQPETTRHVVASFIAGLVAATVCNPADVVKTRMMGNQSRARLDYQYSGFFDCFMQILRREGVWGLMRGWLPSYSRIGPHVLISLPIIEKLRALTGLNSI